MENSEGVEGITRRQFLMYGAVAAGVTALGNVAYADAAQKLQEYREKLFGRHSLFGAGGVLGHINYEQWQRDKDKGTWEFDEAVIDARRFFVDIEKIKLYHDAFGKNSPAVRMKDQRRVVEALLNGLHVPSKYHTTIRELLKADGILDFESHKRDVEQGLERAPQYLKSDAAKAALKAASKALDDRIIDDAAHGLEYMFALTLPIGSLDDYRAVEDDIRGTLRASGKALQNARNLYEAMQNNDYMKTGHQLKSFIFGLRDVFNAVGRLTDKKLLLESTGVSKEIGLAEELVFHHPDMKILTLPEVVKEWDKLNLHVWANEAAAKAKKIVR